MRSMIAWILKTCLLVIVVLFFFQPLFAKSAVDFYNVVWTTPSQNSAGSMPIGNGDIGLNVWVEENGDLLFYISKTDAWSGNGRLLKLGRVRVKIYPNPMKSGMSLKQELHLKQGEIRITMGKPAIDIRLWVDANYPAIRLEATSSKKIDIEVSLEVWRTEKREITDPDEKNSARGLINNDQIDEIYPIVVESETVLPARENGLYWYHRNSTSCYPVTLKNQHLTEFITKYPDPLKENTFGGAIIGEGMQSVDNQTLKSKKPGKKFNVTIYALTQKTATVNEWLTSLQNIIENDNKTITSARKAHQQWWHDFWDRSWIFVEGDSDAEMVTRGYILQRFMNACAGRGNMPIKFNGSIFNFDLKDVTIANMTGFDADYRRWGGMYWFQNTRLIYWSMLSSGDFDLMKPWFDMYKKALPLAKDICRKYYSHDGAAFPETMYFWGTFGNTDFGWGNPKYTTVNNYIRYYWSGGLELVAIMLDYYDRTRDDEFIQNYLIPLATEIMDFFYLHWPVNRDTGTLRFYPAMSLETWHEATNPLPEIAGLHFILPRLMALPDISNKEKIKWTTFSKFLPEIPIREENGRKFLLPAEYFTRKSNSENPELYAVFPYRLYGQYKPEYDVALETWDRRLVKRTGGWTQDPIQAAMLGLTEDATQRITELFSTWCEQCRFPAFWGPNFDWVPDQDHGEVGLIALQRMLMQCENENIYILPAWPKKWDVHFKLRANDNTIVQGKVKNGKLSELETSPIKRRQNVIFAEKWQKN